MSLLFIANIIGSVCALIGVLLLCHKKKLGFVVFLVVEACFGYIGYVSGNYGIVACAIIYLITNAYGYYRWSKDEYIS